MASITVVKSESEKGWTCAVQITEDDGQTRHSVTLSRDVFEQLRGKKETTPENLIRKSFEFLLERESKNQILRQFDLPIITQYFPEYPAEIVKKL